MKYYLLMSVSTDEKKAVTIVYHKHFYFSQQDAFDAANKMRETCVLEMTQTASWTAHQVREWAEQQ